MCINVPGSFECECGPGYFGDGYNCGTLCYCGDCIVG